MTPFAAQGQSPPQQLAAPGHQGDLLGTHCLGQFPSEFDPEGPRATDEDPLCGAQLLLRLTDYLSCVLKASLLKWESHP